ncbi:MAG: histone H1 [Sedimentibacter sp.]
MYKSTKNIFTENLTQLFANFVKDTTTQEEKNKAAGTRAIKTSLPIEKALKEFSRTSINV